MLASAWLLAASMQRPEATQKAPHQASGSFTPSTAKLYKLSDKSCNAKKKMAHWRRVDGMLCSRIGAVVLRQLHTNHCKAVHGSDRSRTAKKQMAHVSTRVNSMLCSRIGAVVLPQFCPKHCKAVHTQRQMLQAHVAGVCSMLYSRVQLVQDCKIAAYRVSLQAHHSEQRQLFAAGRGMDYAAATQQHSTMRNCKTAGSDSTTHSATDPANAALAVGGVVSTPRLQHMYATLALTPAMMP
jgi:hypothetical protein